MGYEFREIICPYCNHRFMFNKGEDGKKYIEFVEKQTGRSLSSAICPKCANTVVALDKVLVGIRDDDEKIITHGIRVL